MADINWNQVYNEYKTQYNDPFKAAEYTIYGRLTGSKKVPKVYTKEEWYDLNAPSYKAVKDYTGDDEATIIVSNSIKELEKNNKPFDIGSVNEIAKKLTVQGYTRGEAYNVVKGIYDEVARAEKSYALQTGANWWKQYDLPDPSKRYDGTTVKLTPAETYIANQTSAYSKKLIASGVSEAVANTRATAFNSSLRTALYNKIKDSVTPFMVAAQQRIKARG